MEGKWTDRIGYRRGGRKRKMQIQSNFALYGREVDEIRIRKDEIRKAKLRKDIPSTE